MNKFIYASDLEWESATTQWGYPAKDLAPSQDLPPVNVKKIQLYKDGVIKPYDKGLGMHAASSVVYNIAGNKFETFEAEIGIQADNGRPETKVNFIIKVDEQIVFEKHNILYHTSETVSVSVKGASKIELITGSDSNAGGIANINYCHTVWADAKFVQKDFEYVSDLEWTSAKCGFLQVTKDKTPDGASLSLFVDGVKTDYEKGIWCHANSEVIYDISNEEVIKFISKIGINSTNGTVNSKVKYLIEVDGNKIYESSILSYHTSDYVDIDIPEGANQIKLITIYTSTNAEGCHTIWADAKFKY